MGKEGIDWGKLGRSGVEWRRVSLQLPGLCSARPGFVGVSTPTEIGTSTFNFPDLGLFWEGKEIMPCCQIVQLAWRPIESKVNSSVTKLCQRDINELPFGIKEHSWSLKTSTYTLGPKISRVTTFISTRAQTSLTAN